MARLLVQLKLRLLLNALRASSGAQIAFVLSTVFAALIAGGVFYLLSILRGDGIAAADLTTVIFCSSGSRGWSCRSSSSASTAPWTPPRWPSTRSASARSRWDCWPPRLPAPGRRPPCSACSG